MEKPVIFLDIDGVVYPCHQRRLIIKDTRYIRAQVKDHGYKSALLNDLDLCASAYGFDSKAISYLKELIEKSNAELVISSSWKFSRDLQTLKALFSLHELDRYIRDMTSNAMGFMKEEGILDYLETHRIQQYVVLDDIAMEETFHHHAICCPDVFDEVCYQKALQVLLP